MSHTIRDKSKLLTRIHRIQGQVEGLKKALERESECMAVLQQIAAVRGAVNGLMTEVLENHIREHLGNDMLTPPQRAGEIEQVIAVLRSYLR